MAYDTGNHMAGPGRRPHARPDSPSPMVHDVLALDREYGQQTGLTQAAALTRLRQSGVSDLAAVRAIEMAPGAGDGGVIVDGNLVSFAEGYGWAVTPASQAPAADARTREASMAAFDEAALVWPDLSGEYNVSEILAAVRLVDACLDATTAQAYQDQPLAGHWSRIGKAAAEAQEAVEALGGVTGENPRKGVCDTWDHVMEELGDTACAALLAIQHITKDTDATWSVFIGALAKAVSRVPQERPELVRAAERDPQYWPEPGTPGVAAHCRRCAASGVGACDDFPNCPNGRSQ